MVVALAIRLVTLAWVAVETALVVRERRWRRASAGLDRRSYLVLSVSVVSAIAITIAFASSNRTEPRLAIALAVLAAGVALRVWAVRTLGAAFRVVVSISEDQRLVTGGPYRILRHPSYTGLLLALLGIGLANGTVISVAAVIVVPVPAILWRVHVEEAALDASFGSAWEEYARHTRRLVPGLW